MSKPALLVLCTGNSCRSQMAEAFLRAEVGERFDVYSAGTEPATEVHPLAVEAMAEIGYDLSGQRPKGIPELLGRVPVRYLFIVCDSAARSCPSTWPGVLDRYIWPFEDPARAEGSEEERLAVFRRVRDQIGERFCAWAADHSSARV
jgi:arsenate reductase